MDARRRLHVDRGQPLQAGRPPTSRGPSGAPARSGHPADGRVRVARETSGRKGKAVTLVTGLPLTLEMLEALGRELKQRCGTGGSVKGGVIELQGDHRDVVMQVLRDAGFDPVLAGG